MWICHITDTLCLWIMKLWIMNVDTKTKILLKFGSLESVCGYDVQKASELATLLIVYMHAHTRVNSTCFVCGL